MRLRVSELRRQRLQGLSQRLERAELSQIAQPRSGSTWR